MPTSLAEKHVFTDGTIHYPIREVVAICPNVEPMSADINGPLGYGPLVALTECAE